MTSAGQRRRPLKPVERHRLTDQAYDAMRESILNGTLRAGERLVEMRLATELDMSRAPIREAIQRLAKEGLVIEHAHRGAFVISLAPSDIVDLYNLRVGLEVTALRLFMKRDAGTASLWEQIDHMERAADRQDIAAIVRAEVAFHRHIVEGSENAVLIKVFLDLESQLRLVIAIDDGAYGRLHDVATEHVPVVRAIEAADETAAVQVFEDHLLSTVNAALESLGGDGSALLSPLHVAQPAAGTAER